MEYLEELKIYIVTCNVEIKIWLSCYVFNRKNVHLCWRLAGTRCGNHKMGLDMCDVRVF